MPSSLSHGYWVGYEKPTKEGKPGLIHLFFYTGTGPHADAPWGLKLDKVLWVKHDEADVNLLSTIGTRPPDKVSIPLKFPDGEPQGYWWDYKNGGKFLLKPHKCKMEKLPFNFPIQLRTPDRPSTPPASDTTASDSIGCGGVECFQHSSSNSDQEGPDVRSAVGLGTPSFKNWQFEGPEPVVGLGKPDRTDWLIEFSDSDSDD